MLELWGGHECTVNRVGDAFRDQTGETGHQDRVSDLQAFAACHIKALRYPVVWERVSPDRPDAYDWDWTDARLAEIRRLGMRPIVGLLHHGSGPRYTSLISDNFVELFAGFAKAAAERYPWVDDWTPVNEPLTTARFSALYGHWYPHAKDERTFWLALLNQIDGVRAAMAAIRQVNPAARLVQTEDLGQTLATAPLQGVADFENDRRWMSWDLLTGKVDAGHPLWARLERLGYGDRLRAIADAPCPPDVIGVNHYLTSIRFLDHRRERYPNWIIGPGEHADMDAVRILQPNPVGLGSLLLQTWARYGLPMAVTECHNGCTREEQMRWLFEAWRTCCDLQAEGVDVRALTAWALLGGFDWSSLITRPDGRYEVGPFDVTSGQARPTAIVDMLTRLGRGDGVAAVQAAIPQLASAGWWNRDIRLEHEALDLGLETAVQAAVPAVSGPPILICGTGALARALIDACALRGLACRAESECAPSDAAFSDSLGDDAPWAIVDAANWIRAEAITPAGPPGVRRLGFASDPRLQVQRSLGLVVQTSDIRLLDDVALKPEVIRTALDLLIDGETGVWPIWPLTHSLPANGEAASVSGIV